MHAIVPPSNPSVALFTARRRDRRATFGDLLITLARAVQHREATASFRGTFEATLQRLLPVQTVQLRDCSYRWSARPPSPKATESICLDVPGPDPFGPGVLEATFDRNAPLGEWDFQMLGLAAHLASLVLEVERAQHQLARAGLSHSGQVRADSVAPLIGSTTAMRHLRDMIARVATTDFTVLLEGESGVGKELVARQIHELSRRKNGPFVAVNCAALVETLLEAELFGIEDRIATGVRARRGKFEAADAGTLFLDEVSDLSPSAQAKLLRAIQDLAVERVGGNGTQRVDIRIVAATNRPLAALVERRAFRPDLFYRLSGVDIRVPSLRERPDDVMELARYFLGRHRASRSMSFSPAAEAALAAYEWPGNVRELERLIERIIALGPSEVIDIEDLPPIVGGTYQTAIGPALKSDETLRTWARRYVRLVLERCGGNRRQAARSLGISYHTLKAYLRPPVERRLAAQLADCASEVIDASGAA